MEIKNKTQLLEAIRKQALGLIKETQDLTVLDNKLKDVDEGFVQVNEKRLDRLNSEEEKAMSEENYAELQRIKQEKVIILGKLIASYKKKTEILEQIQSGIKEELSELDTKGNEVFKDKKLPEFKSEEFVKGDVLKISTLTSETKLEKISQNNQYEVIETTMQGVESGDILVMPDMVVGHSGKVKVYRKIGQRFEEVGDITLNTIKEVVKSPS